MSAEPAPENQSYEEVRRSEVALLLALLAGFLLINLATASWYPVVWVDEVYYADPAVNLYLGNGFTSTAWERPRDEFWASNCPLYQFLLYGWLSLFGFGLTQVRSLNYLLMVVVVLLMWGAVVRLRLLTTRQSRILLVLLLLLGDGIAFAYRCGRPDVVTMFPFALGFLAYSIESAPLRRLLYFLAGLWLPFAAVQGVIFFVLLGLLLTPYFGRRLIEPWLVAALGIILGSALLMSVYRAHGVDEVFLALTVRSTHSIVPEVQTLLTTLDAQPLFDRLARRLRFGPFMDWSASLLFLGALMLLLIQWHRERLHWRSPLVATLGVCILIPFGISIAGKFPLYYSWMLYLPACIAYLLAIQELSPQVSAEQALRRLATTFLALALFMGLPFQLLLAHWNRETCDYSRVEELVRRQVTAEDWLYCDPACYYAAKNVTPHVFVSSHGLAMTAEDKQRITAVILRNDGLDYWDWLPPDLLPHWRESALRPRMPEKSIHIIRHWYYTDYRSLRVYLPVLPSDRDASKSPATSLFSTPSPDSR